jgi:hypothetical protein
VRGVTLNSRLHRNRRGSRPRYRSDRSLRWLRSLLNAQPLDSIRRVRLS